LCAVIPLTETVGENFFWRVSCRTFAAGQRAEFEGEYVLRKIGRENLEMRLDGFDQGLMAVLLMGVRKPLKSSIQSGLLAVLRDSLAFRHAIPVGEELGKGRLFSLG